MKYLLFVLLFSIGYGQDSIKYYPRLQPAPMPRFAEPYIPNQYGYSKPIDISKILIPEILKLLDGYKTECYNDSTVVEDLAPCFSAIYPPCKGHSYEPKRFHVERKDCNSLEGFMEYLRRVK